MYNVHIMNECVWLDRSWCKKEQNISVSYDFKDIIDMLQGLSCTLKFALNRKWNLRGQSRRCWRDVGWQFGNFGLGVLPEFSPLVCNGRLEFFHIQRGGVGLRLFASALKGYDLVCVWECMRGASCRRPPPFCGIWPYVCICNHSIVTSYWTKVPIYKCLRCSYLLLWYKGFFRISGNWISRSYNTMSYSNTLSQIAYRSCVCLSYFISLLTERVVLSGISKYTWN